MKIHTKIFALMILACLAGTKNLSAYGYTVGKGDILTVDVYREKDFTGDFAVDSFGKLHYPVVGDIPVDGKTVDEIKLELLGILSKDYLVDPKVTVAVKEYNSKKIMVLGSVAKPGVYPLKEQTKILDVISQAGGINRDGSQRIVVLRKSFSPAVEKAPVQEPSKDLPAVVAIPGPVEKEPAKNIAPSVSVISPKEGIETSEISLPEVDSNKAKRKIDIPEPLEITGSIQKQPETADAAAKENISSSESESAKTPPSPERLNPYAQVSDLKPIMVDYGKILKNGDISQNIEILGGDVINVPKANEIFVFGSVKSPGPVKYDDNMGVLQAVALAGGTSQEASPGSTYILRLEANGKEEKIKVNLSKVLKQKAKNIEVKPNDVIVVPESFF